MNNVDRNKNKKRFLIVSCLDRRWILETPPYSFPEYIKLTICTELPSLGRIGLVVGRRSANKNISLFTKLWLRIKLGPISGSVKNKWRLCSINKDFSEITSSRKPTCLYKS